MADFNWYLNKQGLRGFTGPKGDQGFSPIINVVTDTLEEYRLRITTEDDEIETPNLKGSSSIQDQGGTYVRYDRETGELTANEADRASSEIYGVVRLAKSEDLTNLELQDTVAITPESLREGLSLSLTSPDNSIQIALNPDTQKTEISANTSFIIESINQERSERIEADNTERSERIASDSSIRQSISTLSNSLQATNTRVSNVTSDLATEKQVRLAADTQQQAQIDAERQEREVQDAALQNQLNTKLTADNIKAGDNVTITKDGNNVTISSTGGGGPVPENIMTLDTNQTVTGEKIFTDNTLKIGNNGGYATLANFDNTEHFTNLEHTSSFRDATVLKGSVIAEGTLYKPQTVFNPDFTINQFYSPVLSEADVDNQTIKIVNGVLHADFSEIGDEVNALSNRVNTLENEVVVATDDRIGMVKPDGTSITINSDGVISSTGGSVPEVDNNTIEINSEGKLQTTVDINELQAKVEDLALFKFPNATIIGEPTINNGQISNFNSTNYLQFPFEFETKGRTWLLNGSFTTGSDVTTQQNIIDSLASIALAVRSGRLVMALSTNGTTFDLGEHVSMSDIEANTTYYFRITFSGVAYTLSLSTDKIDYMPEAVVESSSPIASTVMTISSSGHPFGNIINLNDWNLTVANTLVWQGMDDVGIASRMDVNASNITESGKENIKDIAGVGQIEEALDLLNGADITLLSTKADLNYVNDQLDTKLDNSSSLIANDRFDGQWTKKSNVIISSSTSLTAKQKYEYDLSSYLPNDNNQYSVLITAKGVTGGNTGDTADMLVGSDIFDALQTRIAFSVSRVANSTAAWGGSVILPVGSGRKIYIYQTSTTNVSCTYLAVIGYRRCGSNT